MTYTISNECLRVSAYSLGAELRSLRKQAGGVEYLWQGAADSWKGRAPLLFPVIGRLKRGSYSFGGRTYAMGIHGFAKDAQFDATMRGETCLSFFLRDSPQTLELWPFEFELEIRYSLLGSALRKEHILRLTRAAGSLLTCPSASRSGRCSNRLRR